MHDVMVVQIAQSIEDLPHDSFDFIFGRKSHNIEGRRLHEFHDQPSSPFFQVEIESLIFNKILMSDIFHEKEISLKSSQMFLLEPERLNSELLSTLSLSTLVNNSI
jgi:hypothetical protein